MKNIVVLHDNLFGTSIGSTEKLLKDMIAALDDSGEYLVHAVYNPVHGEVGQEETAARANVRLRPFPSFGPPPPPDSYLTLDLNFGRMLAECRPDALLLIIGQAYNPYVLQTPPYVPLFPVSPFGAYASNGNVRKLYVSGRVPTMRLRNAGYSFAEQFFNPLRIPPFNAAKAAGPFNAAKAAGRNPDAPILFGRTGRNDEEIFDPISIDAFARLERTYGDKVRYVYVNPSQRAEEYADKLGVQRIEFRRWLSEDELTAFYQDIDVFAHARRDGETLGVSVVEALLAQNPVITHVSAFNNEHHAFLREPFGKIAPHQDADAYLAAMVHYVENRERLGEFGVLGRESVLPLFSPDAIAAKFVADMGEVCRWTGRPRDAYDVF